MVLTALAYGAVPFLLAVLGAATTARWRPSARLRSGVQHVAAGVVFAAVAGEVVPDIAQRHSPTATVVGFAVGTAVVLGLRQLRNRADAAGHTSPTSLIAAVGVDVAIDGVLVGVGVTVGGHAALLLTIALSLELLFLGLTVSAQILQNSSPRTAIATTAALAALLPMDTNEDDTPQIATPGASPAQPRRRRTTRNLLVGLVAAGSLVLTTAGVALARSDNGNAAKPEGRSGMSREMKAMHGSEEMVRMHAKLSPELRAEIDRMRDRMGEMDGMDGMTHGRMGSMKEHG